MFTVPVLSNLDVIIACHCFSELIFYYSEELRKRSLEHTDQTRALSVKGTLWVSSFHTNAFAIPLSQIIGGSEQGSASLREYIGISIDAGFRIGRYADTNRISISVELADKLVQIMEKMSLRYLPRLHLKYDQGEPLKGLLRADEHYPRIWLDLDHDQDPPPGHKSLISRDPAKRADLRIAIDVLKNKFQNEFFNWPEHLANFYLLDAVENAEYGDL